MNHVSRSGSRVVITQVPWLILIAFLCLSLPMIGYGLFCILSGREVDGKYFTLFFGAALLWVGLEFAGTVERIEVNPETKILRRTVRGVFWRREQTVSWEGATGFTVQRRVTPNNPSGRRGQFLFLHGPHGGEVLLNTPAKVSLDARKVGRILGEATGLPCEELPADYGFGPGAT